MISPISGRNIQQAQNGRSEILKPQVERNTEESHQDFLGRSVQVQQVLYYNILLDRPYPLTQMVEHIKEAVALQQ